LKHKLILVEKLFIAKYKTRFKNKVKPALLLIYLEKTKLVKNFMKNNKYKYKYLHYSERISCPAMDKIPMDDPQQFLSYPKVSNHFYCAIVITYHLKQEVSNVR